MPNNNTQTENVKHENSLTFEPKVLEKIANYSVSDIDGILELRGDWTTSVKDFFSTRKTTEVPKGVHAEVGEKEVALDLEVIGEYGKDLRAAFEKVVTVVSENVEKMTALKVVEVNMNVTDVLTRSEYERQQNEDERKRREQRREAQNEVQEQNREGQYSDGSRVK